MLTKVLNKYPDYVNNEIKSEFLEKGFYVYNYISTKELVLTARKDFLEILSKINIPFAVITIILGMFSFFIGNFTLLFLFLFLSYVIIFLIIFFKLIGRTRLFLYIADVVYTKTGIMISDDYLYYHKDKEKLEEKLKKYSMIFDEYLSKPSNLEELISKRKKDILDGSLKKSGKLAEILGKMSKSREGGQIAIALVFSTFLYVASLYIFYYIGYFFSFIFSTIYIFFLKIILSFKDKVELKIKKKTISIDKKLNKMNIIYKVLESKINSFKDGEISNLEDFVEDKFSDFYNQINLVLLEVKDLKDNIEKSKYKNIIDFQIFEKYLKKQFNSPIKNMISMLEKYEKFLIKGLNDLNKVNKNSKKQKLDINNTEILDKNLEHKKIILQNNLNLIQTNISKFNTMILK